MKYVQKRRQNNKRNILLYKLGLTNKDYKEKF